MKRILAPILLLVFLFPSLALSEEVPWDDLVWRGGLFYKKFTDVPFSGSVTGEWQGRFKNGKEEGLWVVYYEDGQLWRKGNYRNGKEEGPWVVYHGIGSLSSKLDYKDGVLDGPCVYYRSNGQLISKGDFKNGKKEGPWVEYNEDGTVDEEFTGTYKNGVKVD